MPVPLTRGALLSKLWPVSSHGTDSDKRHRHDIGEVSHGAASQEMVTRGVQYTLALCVIASALLVIYALSASAGAL